eukprot:19539-Heterococcus_DN1.PRE.1
MSTSGDAKTLHYTALHAYARCTIMQAQQVHTTAQQPTAASASAAVLMTALRLSAMSAAL